MYTGKLEIVISVDDNDNREVAITVCDEPLSLDDMLTALQCLKDMVEYAIETNFGQNQNH